MSEASYHYEKQVTCPEDLGDGVLYLERSQTPDGRFIDIFSCSLLEASPGCRQECLAPRASRPTDDRAAPRPRSDPTGKSEGPVAEPADSGPAPGGHPESPEDEA